MTKVNSNRALDVRHLAHVPWLVSVKNSLESDMSKTPWNQSNPKPKAKRKKMTDAQKAQAKAKAKKAGRPYPNLIDNMAIMRRS